jgi:murein DD-endopeptidase MepM/ murein hydrolase activator NlpD
MNLISVLDFIGRSGRSTVVKTKSFLANWNPRFFLLASCLLIPGIVLSRIAPQDSHGSHGSHSAHQPPKMIRISSEHEDGSIRFYIENLQDADVTVTIDMTTSNLVSCTRFPFTATIPGKEKTFAYELTKADKEGDFKWSYNYSCTWGSLTAVHDANAIYALPYAPGKAYKISQGFRGKYSHFGCDEFAIDWKMPIGTPIHAARGGVVVGAKDDSNVGGPDKKYDWDANYILIRHDDGTLGHYVHLQYGGNKVKVGQRVRTGDFIGFSGNTGHSTGPHLHFAVFKARDGKNRETIPVKFRTSDANAIVVREGKSYRAPKGGVQIAHEETPAERNVQSAIGRGPS